MKALGTLCLLMGAMAMAKPAVAQSSDPNSRAHMGVWLDPRPLPGVVTKNLGLQPGKGLRIENIFRNSPADKAGLERDDILIAFQGKDVNDVREFGETVLKMGIGKQVSVDVVQAGHRKTIKLKLVARSKDFEFKYPPEPGFLGVRKIGNIYKQDPRSGTWGPWAPDANGVFPPPLMKMNEVYTINYGQGRDEVTVIIDGDPGADDSTVIVRAGQAEYKSIVGKVGELPKAYRDLVNQAIKAARRESDRDDGPRRGRGRPQPWPGHGGPPANWHPGALDEGQPWSGSTPPILDWIERYLHDLQQSPGPMLKPDQDRLNLLEERLRQLQDQIEQVERHMQKAEPNQPPADPKKQAQP